ncbi:MAG: hypothetical protein KUG68_07955 [Flavobacteriaceae bacterium]|nr:hypothetical protein [Flavobacteriaceae bacterium]
MAQDIRDLLKNDTEQSPLLPNGHEARFEDKLKAAFSEEKQTEATTKKDTFFWMKIAAMIVVVCSVCYFGYVSLEDEPKPIIAEVPTTVEENANQISLGDISPNLKKMEDFYTNGINVQLASLADSKENKELVDGYLIRFKELDTEYARLTKELNEVGPTEETINALIDNLKLRLELLFKLKNKLKELKNQENEQFNSIQS